MKKWIIIVTTVMFILVGCSNHLENHNELAESKGKIKIGSKYFTEQLLLAKLTSIYLQEHGYDVEEVSHMGTTPLRSALENEMIDLYWEYTATAILVHHQKTIPNYEQAYALGKEMDQEEGLIWLEASEINNTYALLIKEEVARELNINTISDLATIVNDSNKTITFGTETEFYYRDDGIRGLEKEYGFTFPEENVIRRDIGMLYDALKDGLVDVAVGFATDARIKAFNLKVLEDDQMFFLPYYLFPIVREDVYTEELNELMKRLVSKLDLETMISLNHAVDMEYKDVAEISRKWLEENELIQ